MQSTLSSSATSLRQQQAQQQKPLTSHSSHQSVQALRWTPSTTAHSATLNGSQLGESIAASSAPVTASPLHRVLSSSGGVGSLLLPPQQPGGLHGAAASFRGTFKWSESAVPAPVTVTATGSSTAEHAEAELVWSDIQQRVMPLFNGQGLKGAIEDINELLRYALYSNYVHT